MTTHTKHEHGIFSWSDLSTSDPAAAKKFYTELFGWTTADFPAGADGAMYSMCRLGESDAAAITEIRKEQKAMGIPSHWNVYFTVANVDDTTNRVASAGGKVHMAPFDVMEMGRMSVVSDPTGATACLWQAKQHQGARVTHEHGALCWAELVSQNVDAAGKFWASVMGWKAEAAPMPMPYTLFKVGDKQTAGMMALGAEMKGIPSHWAAYFQVKNTDATIKRATELGGKVALPAQDVPKVGRFAVLSDGQGATFGIMQPA